MYSIQRDSAQVLVWISMAILFRCIHSYMDGNTWFSSFQGLCSLRQDRQNTWWGGVNPSQSSLCVPRVSRCSGDNCVCSAPCTWTHTKVAPNSKRVKGTSLRDNERSTKRTKQRLTFPHHRHNTLRTYCLQSNSLPLFNSLFCNILSGPDTRWVDLMFNGRGECHYKWPTLML